MMKFNITKLMHGEENLKFHHEIEKELEANQVDVGNIEHMWKTTKEAILAAAKKTLGESRHKSKSWYNDKCRHAVLKRKQSRRDYIENQSAHLKEAFEAERRECKKVLQREKRKFMNELLRSTEQNYTQGNVREFFTTIKKYKQFNPMLKAIYKIKMTEY